MKIVKQIFLITCLIIGVSFEIIYCQTVKPPKVDVIIKKKNLFSKNDYFEMIDLIRARLSKDFKAAWEDCENNIGGLLYCYRDAFNDYKNLIKNQYNNEFIIYFDFTDDFVLYHLLKEGFNSKKFNKENFPGNHSGNAHPGPGQNAVTIYNVYAPQWFMIKYSKNTEHCSYEYILSEVNKYLSENGFESREDHDLLKQYNWNTSGTTSFSIKNMIIHEIFHIVLNSASHKDLKSRTRDEATISDTVVRISPLAGGKGAYGYSYEFISWLLDNQSSITIPLTTATQYIKDDFYDYDVINRKFNPHPPENLRYDQNGYTLGGYLDFFDNTTVNDSNCKEMKKYVIPRKFCVQISYNDTCSPQPPEEENRGPGNDHGDDLFSYSDAVIKEYNLAPEAVIYANGYYQEALKLYGGLKFDGNNTAEELIKISPILIIPSGGLFGKENERHSSLSPFFPFSLLLTKASICV